MLYQIKSSFVLKKIFSLVDNNVKFNSIAHNKKLQRKLGLNLIDFRIFSGRIRKGKDDKILEYNNYNHRLIFSGKYSNGKRNGEGIEYNEEGEEYLKENI